LANCLSISEIGYVAILCPLVPLLVEQCELWPQNFVRIGKFTEPISGVCDKITLQVSGLYVKAGSCHSNRRCATALHISACCSILLICRGLRPMCTSIDSTNGDLPVIQVASGVPGFRRDSGQTKVSNLTIFAAGLDRQNLFQEISYLLGLIKSKLW
jgi:hypothetical protein